MLVGMTFLFTYSSTDLAAKACFQIAHQLQVDYQKANKSFAPDISALKDFDPTCMSRFEMKTVTADDSVFTIIGKSGRKQFSIDQNREWKTF